MKRIVMGVGPTYFGLTMKRAAQCLFAVAMLSTSAAAGDWSLEARTSHHASVENIAGSGRDDDGYVLALLNTVYADAIYKTDHSQLDLMGEVSYRTEWDHNDDNEIDGRLQPELGAKYTTKTKRTATEFEALWSRDEVRYIDALDPLFSNLDAYRDVLSASGSFTYNLDARNSVGVRSSFAHTDFSETSDALVARTDASATAFWTKRMTKRSDLTNSVRVSTVVLDDAQDTLRNAVSLQTDFSTKISPQLRIRLGGGATVGFFRYDGIAPFSSDVETSNDFGWNAEFGFDYKYKRGWIEADANYGTDTSLSGNLSDRWTLRALVVHELNEMSKIESSASARLADLGEANEQTAFDVSTAFVRSLTDEWRMRLGYRYTWLENEAGETHSNNVFLSFTRDWVARP
jgi:hypothetical protein